MYITRSIRMESHAHTMQSHQHVKHEEWIDHIPRDNAALEVKLAIYI